MYTIESRGAEFLRVMQWENQNLLWTVESGGWHDEARQSRGEEINFAHPNQPEEVDNEVTLSKLPEK